MLSKFSVISQHYFYVSWHCLCARWASSQHVWLKGRVVLTGMYTHTHTHTHTHNEWWKAAFSSKRKQNTFVCLLLLLLLLHLLYLFHLLLLYPLLPCWAKAQELVNKASQPAEQPATFKQKDGRRKEGRTDGRTERRKEGRKEGKKERCIS